MTLRLFIAAPLRRELEIKLPGPAARHVQVRRLQPGDGVRLFNGEGGEWSATVLHMGRSEVDVRVDAHAAVERELPCRVTLAVGMPANERMDVLVEKATELGVHTIQPLLCERSVLRLAGERATRKCAHWQAIAVAASEQCGRTQVPRVAPVAALSAWLPGLGMPAAGDGDGDGDGRWLLSLSTDASALPQRWRAQRSLTMLSGPEGGLGAGEQSLALQHGFVAVRLGPRVLRADTAPLAALAWLGVQALSPAHAPPCAETPRP